MKPSDVLDAALEASLVLSFARPGFVLRRWAERWAPSAFDLRGRVFVLTGATSGIGRCTADMLVSRGATTLIPPQSAAVAPSDNAMARTRKRRRRGRSILLPVANTALRAAGVP